MAEYLKFVDYRPFYILELKYYPGGLTLPNEKGSTIKVTPGEAKSLLRYKNGNLPMFEKIVIESRED